MLHCGPRIRERNLYTQYSGRDLVLTAETDLHNNYKLRKSSTQGQEPQCSTVGPRIRERKAHTQNHIVLRSETCGNPNYGEAGFELSAETCPYNNYRLKQKPNSEAGAAVLHSTVGRRIGERVS